MEGNFFGGSNSNNASILYPSRVRTLSIFYINTKQAKQKLIPSILRNSKLSGKEGGREMMNTASIFNGNIKFYNYFISIPTTPSKTLRDNIEAISSYQGRRLCPAPYEVLIESSINEIPGSLHEAYEENTQFFEITDTLNPFFIFPQLHYLQHPRKGDDVGQRNLHSHERDKECPRPGKVSPIIVRKTPMTCNTIMSFTLGN